MGLDELVIVEAIGNHYTRNAPQINNTTVVQMNFDNHQSLNGALEKSEKLSKFEHSGREIEKPICRICHCSSEDFEPEPKIFPKKPKKFNSCSKQSDQNLKKKSKLSYFNDPFLFITPCFCTGTLQYVHHKCLQQWIRSSNHKYCELCKYNFKLTTKNRPFYQWECLKMTKSKQRKLVFHILFNLISMICVFWSIYVIAERAAHELTGQLGWRFWVKMLVIIIGFVCGVMFIFFQFKLYLSVLLRWKQYNQIIIIENLYHEQHAKVKNKTNSKLSNHPTMAPVLESSS